MRLDALAQRVGGELAGDPTIEVGAVAPPEEARPDTIVVLSDPRRLPEVEAAGAPVILGRDAPPTALPSIRVQNIRMALALALQALVRRRAPRPGVHPTCVLGTGVRLGQDASLGPYVVVGDGVSIGDRTQIHAHGVIEDGVEIGPDGVLHPRVTIRHGCRVGARVVIQSGAVVGSDGFGYAQDERRRHVAIPQVGGASIGDDVELGVGVAVARGTLGVTRIGRGTKIDNFVQIAHNVEIGEDCAIAAAVFIAGSTRIGNRVLIAGWVGVSDHVEIPDDCLILGGAGVWRDIPPGSVVAGNPAQPRAAQRRCEAAILRLPETMKRLRELEQRIRHLEGR